MFPLFKGGCGEAERDFTPLSQATFPLGRGKQKNVPLYEMGSPTCRGGDF